MYFTVLYLTFLSWTLVPINLFARRMAQTACSGVTTCLLEVTFLANYVEGSQFSKTPMLGLRLGIFSQIPNMEFER